MVSEGFDVKDIETIYLFSRVSSQILIRQRVGRVLRVFEDKKNKRKKEKATVYWQNYFDYEKPKQFLNILEITVKMIMKKMIWKFREILEGGKKDISCQQECIWRSCQEI